MRCGFCGTDVDVDGGYTVCPSCGAEYKRTWGMIPALAGFGIFLFIPYLVMMDALDVVRSFSSQLMIYMIFFIPLVIYGFQRVKRAPMGWYRKEKR